MLSDRVGRLGEALAVVASRGMPAPCLHCLIALLLLCGSLVCGSSRAQPVATPGPDPAALAATEAAPVMTAPESLAVQILPRNPEHWDASVFSGPSYKADLLGHVARDAHIQLRGIVRLAEAPYCETNLYYALEPFGFLCGDDGHPSNGPLTTASVLVVPEGAVLPFEYAMVQTPEEETLPLFRSPEDIADFANPKRMLGRGDTLAVGPKTLAVEGQRYRRTLDGDVLSADKTYKMRRFSEWHGEVITPETAFPFGWISRHKVTVYDSPGGSKVGELVRRDRVQILGEQQEGKKRWLQIGEGRFVRANRVNEVRKIERPEGTGTLPQWIDVELGEQVVVAYRGDQPQYATMTSSGRPPNRTPRGNYPVWAKASAITMRSQPYDDKPFYVDRVPWVLFFQAHNALHGAYWHDRFGAVKSHGCANLSPLDARYLFEWLEPGLPPGWTALRYPDLTASPVVHVRNTRYRNPFRQERPIGPPTREAEAERLAAAEERRAKERAAADGGVADGAVKTPATSSTTATIPHAQPPAAAHVPIPTYQP